MGDRYYLSMECPVCGEKEDEVYFAPTCGIVEWECPLCRHLVDLCEYTGISYADASNADLIEALAELPQIELAEKFRKLQTRQISFGGSS